MVASALNFHLLIDLILPVVNDRQPFDCIEAAAVWLDFVCHCHYSNGHFVNLM